MTTVNYIDASDWIEYDVDIALSGKHILQFNVTTPHSNSKLQIKCADETLCTIEIPNTGGWKNWQVVQFSITLKEGFHALELFAEGNGFNISEFTFTHISSLELSADTLL